MGQKTQHGLPAPKQELERNCLAHIHHVLPHTGQALASMDYGNLVPPSSIPSTSPHTLAMMMHLFILTLKSAPDSYMLELLRRHAWGPCTPSHPEPTCRACTRLGVITTLTALSMSPSTHIPFHATISAPHMPDA